jgi:hypothetical protein
MARISNAAERPRAFLEDDFLEDKKSAGGPGGGPPRISYINKLARQNVQLHRFCT